MVAAGYFAPVVINVVGALVAIALGAWIRARLPEGASGRAVSRFSVWWLGVGAFILLGQASAVAAALGLVGAIGASVLIYGGVAAIAVMLWGLVSFIVYLYTGRVGAFRVVDAAYALQLVLGFAYVAVQSPTAIVAGEWGPRNVYAHAAPPIGGLLFAAFFLVPPIVGAILVGVAGLRSKSRSTRYRACAVGLGILLWFSGSLVLNALVAAGAPLSASMAVGGPLFGFLCMLLVASAYKPPAWLRAWGVEPFGERARAESRRDAKRDALHERANELV